MKTDNIRLAAYLLTLGHSLRGIEITPAGYGLVTFDDSALPDATTFDAGGDAHAKALMANYRTLIRRVDELKRGGAR